MTRNWPWTLFAAVAVFGMLTGIGPDDFGLLAAAALGALVLLATFGRSGKRDRHDELVRGIEQQMHDHRRAARARRTAAGRTRSGCL